MREVSDNRAQRFVQRWCQCDGLASGANKPCDLGSGEQALKVSLVESFALGSIPRMEPQIRGQTASRPEGVKLLRLASASSTVPAGALPQATAGNVQAVPVPASPVSTSPVSTSLAGASRGYAIQLGAFGTSGSANREWRQLKQRFAPQLSGLSPQVVRAGGSFGQVYRLQARTGSEAQARSICSALKAQSQPCVPVLPH